MSIDPRQLSEIDRLKARLDTERPLTAEVVSALRHASDVELTYTSNAIEGNTLSHLETALVIEKGITIGGKTLAEHLEAQDHYAAVQMMHELAGASRAVSENDIRELHRRIVLRSRPEIGGVYSLLPRRIAGSDVIFPSPAKVPGLMAELAGWMATVAAGPEAAFEVHLRLVSIHPFADGNGRTARLLMNLLLIRSGFPPIAVRPMDRQRYLEGLQACHGGGDDSTYYALLAERLIETLTDYVNKVEQAAAARSSER